MPITRVKPGIVDSTDDSALSSADGLLCQLRVVDGELILDIDAEPGCQWSIDYAPEVLRAAADLAERRLDALTTLRSRGAVPRYVM